MLNKTWKKHPYALYNKLLDSFIKTLGQIPYRPELRMEKGARDTTCHGKSQPLFLRTVTCPRLAKVCTWVSGYKSSWKSSDLRGTLKGITWQNPLLLILHRRTCRVYRCFRGGWAFPVGKCFNWDISRKSRRNLGLIFCLDKTPSFFAKKTWHKIKTGSTLDYLRS